LVGAVQALEPLDLQRARATLLEAWLMALYAGRFARAADEHAIARLARAMPRAGQLPETTVDLLLDGLALLDADYAGGVLVLRRALQICVVNEGDDDGDLRVLELACQATIELLDLEVLRTLAGRAVRLARTRGALMALVPALGYQSLVEVQLGQFAAADRTICQGEEIARASGNSGIFGNSNALELPVLAWRGSEARAREMAAVALTEYVARGQGGMINHIRGSMTVLELGLGDYDAALASARPVYDEDPFYWGTSILPDFIEAAFRSGRHDEASAALERFSQRARCSGTPQAQGLLARAGALLARDGDAEALYTAAVDHLERSRAAPQLGRAHLAYGEWLRRHRRILDARIQLKKARELFHSIGANGFAERARAELLATGERSPRRAVEVSDVLTTHERSIALLVKDGSSNKEIGARLFISPSTVDYHLRKVFRKLGVNTRTELARRMFEEFPPDDI
jgi:DNA-binding CsgD family transcriptional regulator